ncbi:MAG TPA: signal peptidase I [Opitutaceae bacterium]|nr:signal peptidase I [Opitutaceae bacterium]
MAGFRTEFTLLARGGRRLLGMVGLGGEEHRMRENARNWLEVAERIWHYRRDQLADSERRELLARKEALRTARRDRAESAKLRLLIEELEGVLRRTGGRIYPKPAWGEYVEFFLVAAIVILGIRTYFVQPFKIPTNSMWPSYYGMTPVVYREPGEHPGPAARALRLLALGAWNYDIASPDTGEISADFFPNGLLAYREVPGRRWLVLPATRHEYTLEVNGTPARITVPEDFRLDEVVQQAFFGGPAAMRAQLERENGRGEAEPHLLNVRDGDEPARVYRFPLGRTARRGETLLSFDLLAGDQLFVDRISYHFRRPQVGQGFVFRTDNIPGLGEDGRRIQQYYIKRLVGVPGDTLEIKSHALYRNGRPITGADAFDRNARQVDSYPGYRNLGDLGVGRTMTVPAHGFLALGDNSANSEDGRFWGYVPAKDVIGTPLFIYYPFTRRWGPVR